MRRKDVEEDYFDGHEKEAKMFSAYENPISNGGRVEPLRDLEPFPPPSDFLDNVLCLLLKERKSLYWVFRYYGMKKVRFWARVHFEFRV